MLIASQYSEFILELNDRMRQLITAITFSWGTLIATLVWFYYHFWRAMIRTEGEVPSSSALLQENLSYEPRVNTDNCSLATLTTYNQVLDRYKQHN